MSVKANVIFQFAKVYDITKFEVELGQNFSIELEEFSGSAAGWYSNFDSVLAYDVTSDGNLGVFIAAQAGHSTITIFDSSDNKVKTLQIEVTFNKASKLEVTTGLPIAK